MPSSIEFSASAELYPELWALKDGAGFLEVPEGWRNDILTWTDEVECRADLSKWRKIAKRPALVPTRIK